MAYSLWFWRWCWKFLGVAVFTSVLPACASRSVAPRPPHCIYLHRGRENTAELDSQLIAARQPLLRCIGETAQRGHLDEAHQCYRSLRFLESARWWLKTIMDQDEMDQVYQPSESFKQEFLCRIVNLAHAKSASAVEQLYLEMIQSYP